MQTTATTLSRFIALPESIAVIIPTTTAKNQLAALTLLNQVKSTVIRKLAELTGGCTVTTGTGAYIDSDGLQIDESVIIAESNTENAILFADDLVNLAQWIKETMTQESVAIKINNTLYLVS
jgi:hypothetical protein